MKKIYISLLLAIATNVNAKSPPNFNTQTGVVSFPMVTVDYKKTFTDVQLLLDSNGQWQVLSAKQEQEQFVLNVEGIWRGTPLDIGGNGVVISSIGSILYNFEGLPPTSPYFELRLFQENHKITGILCSISSVSSCDDTLPEEIQNIVGTVNDNSISLWLDGGEAGNSSLFKTKGSLIQVKGNEYLMGELLIPPFEIYDWGFSRVIKK